MKNVKYRQTKKIGSFLDQILIENKNDFGLIQITDEVIVTVIKKIICDVEGVTKLAGGNFIENITSIIYSQKSEPSISVKIKANAIDVEVKICVAYGKQISEVAQNVQTAIITEVKRMVGIDVSNINVIVQEIEDISQKIKK